MCAMEENLIRCGQNTEPSKTPNSSPEIPVASPRLISTERTWATIPDDVTIFLLVPRLSGL